MNSETFIDFINDSSKLYQMPYEELKSLSLRYPWCQHLHLLLLKKSKQDNHSEYERNLHLTAMYSVDRTHLYLQLIAEETMESSEENFLLQDEFLELKDLSVVDREVRGELIKLEHITPPATLEEVLTAELNIEPIEKNTFTTSEEEQPLELNEEEEDLLLGSILNAATEAELTAKANTKEDIVVEDLEAISNIDLNLNEVIEDMEAREEEKTLQETEESTPKLVVNNTDLEEIIGELEQESGANTAEIDLEDLFGDSAIEEIALLNVVEQAPAENQITGEALTAENQLHNDSTEYLDEENTSFEELVDDLDNLLEEAPGNRPGAEEQLISENLDTAEQDDILTELDDLLGIDSADMSQEAEAVGDNGALMTGKNNLAQDLEEEMIGAIPAQPSHQDSHTREAATIEDTIDVEVDELLNELDDQVVKDKFSEQENEEETAAHLMDQLDELLGEQPTESTDELLSDIELDFNPSLEEEIPFEVVNTMETLDDEDLAEAEIPVVDVSKFVPKKIEKKEKEIKAKNKKAKKKKKKKKKNSEARRVAKESLEEDEEIGSELLAEILVMQGNEEKAIEMYQRLSLANPEKSSYFAAKIAELEEEYDDED